VESTLNARAVLYAVGVVELELESTSALVLLLFVIPLAFTLSGFLLWILYSLNGASPPAHAEIVWLTQTAMQGRSRSCR
jgi:hypothetical protein